MLAIKPRNTLAGDGDAIVVPDGVAALELGASLGIVIGRTACRVPRASALEFIAGYTIVNDVSIPVPSHYRPSVRFKARDGFCPIGPQAVPAARIDNPDALAVRVLVDDELVHRTTTGDRIRGVAQLIADVTEFMTLQPGDLLMLGAAAGAPRARAGQRVAIEIRRAGHAAKPAGGRRAGRMKTARVAYRGAVHSATPHAQGVRLADGRVLADDAVVWLPPFEVGTIIALGLNYADHVKELSRELTVNTQDEPLVFFKTPGALVGHRGQSRRPAGVKFMHYECELAVVIGRTARRVTRADAMQHVAGYTVCNDYAIRDYLENWYRPNLRVKNRDGCTAHRPLVRRRRRRARPAGAGAAHAGQRPAHAAGPHLEHGALHRRR